MTSIRRSITTLVSGNALAQLITLCALPILSRIYGPASFGALASFAAVAALIGVIATARYDLSVVLPRSAREAATLRRLARRIVAIVSGITIVGTVAFAFLAIPMQIEYSPWFLVLGISIFLAGETSILYFWFTRTQNYRVQSASRVIQAAGTAIAQIALGLTVLIGPGGLILGTIAGQLLGVLFLLRKDDSRSIRIDRNARREKLVLYRYRKMPLLNGPNALVDSLRTNGIVFVIGAVSASFLGQFSMALRTVQAPLGLIGGAISQVFYQRMATAEPYELRRVVLSSVVRSLALGVVPFGIIFFAAPPLIPIFLGSEWVVAGQLAQALTPWLYLNLATAPISTVFLVANRQGLALLFATVYMAVPLALLWALRSDLVVAVWVMSMCMAGLLIVNVLLALYVATKHANRHPKR